jgi:flagellar FliJ protein
MRKFEFRLQSVLDYRQTLEDARLRDFAEAQAKVYEQNEYLKRKFAEEDKGKLDLKAMNEDHLNVIQIRLQMSHLAAIARQIQLGYQELQMRMRLQEDARLALIEARKNRRALELLKEKKHKAWEQEARREEQKMFDEIAGSRHRRETA